MKSDSELMNELAHRSSYLREISYDEAVSLKRILLKMYKDIYALCEQQNLTIMLCGGSCLGAVRHKGFIPWDDDLDLMMPRKDYNQLINLLRDGALADDYEYTTPNPTTDSKNAFLKIYLKGTVCIDLHSAESSFPTGISVDIFAIDAVPKYQWLQRVKGFVANGLQFISLIVFMAQYPSKVLREYMSLDKHLLRRYRIKIFLGSVFGIIPHRKWVWWFDKFVASTKENRSWGIPTGRKYYNGEIFPKSVFFPAIEAEFEGVKVYIPNGYDQYLRNLYHDYMKLPPPEKRERHFIIKFEVPNDIKY